jgi:uncharacterized protein (TIGR03084 family)
MLQQALDFKTESNHLYEMLRHVDAGYFKSPTQFKKWTINTVLQHLHYFNVAADLSLVNEEKFLNLLNDLRSAGKDGQSTVAHTREKLDDLGGPALLHTWHDFSTEMASRFLKANPKARVRWAGPDMSVLSSITARLMETWSHSQSIYDMLGHNRTNHDYIKNIVVLGNNTFKWTFINRGETVPSQQPFLQLKGPSGVSWEFNGKSELNYIKGQAVEFCQVVTQTRNIMDTGLKVVGKTAVRWMDIGQCFAGPPSEPPSAGTRFMQTDIRAISKTTN